jgi:SPP1 family predicted phage head-tail adaptor
MAVPAIGALRHRLMLQAPLDTPDNAGGFRRAWSDTAPVWAAVEAGSAFDPGRVQSGQSITHRITMRWRDDITAGHRLRDGTRIYIIRSVHDATGEQRFLTAMTEENRP